jgi:amidase
MNDINYASIQEIHDLFKEKKLTVRELVLKYLSRIAKLDQCENGLNSVLEINPDALFIADTLDKKLAKGEEMSPLFGIPVLLKDNINTADRMHTSAGSVALADNYAPYDAPIVERLREAGALMLGKVNMTEFAAYMSCDGLPSGYSSLGGQVLNPYNREKDPSGSSSGSGVAVAAGLCTVSVGTETAGSILCPAANNGIVGIKPTIGLVGRSGIIPIASTQDTAGPMTRTVRDAAILLNIIAGYDPYDPATHGQDNHVDYTKYLDPNGLKGLRIGINRSHNKNNIPTEEEKAAFDNLCQSLSAAGAILVDNVDIETSPHVIEVLRGEFKTCINHYLSTLKGSTAMKTLNDIIEYNQANAPVALKYGQSLLTDAQNKTTGRMTEPAYIEALLEREKAINQLDKLFDDNNIDIMLCETFNNIAPFTGFPWMSIPIGQKEDNVPMGSYWIARRFDEATLIKATYAMEQILNLNLRPKFNEDIK